MEKSMLIFQPRKIWNKFWSISMEEENNFPDLI